MKSFKERLQMTVKETSSAGFTKFSKLFLAGGGKVINFKLLPLDGALFETAWLHGNYKNPENSYQYGESFICLGEGCPLCSHVDELAEREGYHANAWRYRSQKYGLYWVWDLDANRLALLHVAMGGKKGNKTVNEQFLDFLQGIDENSFNNAEIQVKTKNNGEGKTEYSFECKSSSPLTTEQNDVTGKVSLIVPYKEYSVEQLKKVVEHNK